MFELSHNFTSHFENINDPRKHNHNLRHRLIDIIIYTILAVICGADSWVEVEVFAKSKVEWLKSFLEIPHGIASHDIIGDLFSRLNPDEFNSAFMSWVRAISTASKGGIVALDGKAVRASYKDGDKKSAIHVVSAWCETNSIVLGQLKTEDKSNEITAIPRLLEMIEVKGATVTIDAMGCQKKIAEKIIEKEADYVLAVKANQPHLLEDIQNVFSIFDNAATSYEYIESNEKNRDRREQRKHWACDKIDSIRNKEEWKGLQSLGKIESQTYRNGEIHTETRYYISSTKPDAKKFSEAVRKHWQIENKLHWSLDVNFSEDKCRVREGYAAANFTLIRKIAHAALIKDKTSKTGMAAKRKKAGWDNRYLSKILNFIGVGQT